MAAFEKDQIAQKIEVNGIVQGVGFRPFVFQLANDCGLKGEIANTADGVSIWVEGAVENVKRFLEEMRRNPPPLAHITEIRSREAPPAGFQLFSIVASRKRGNSHSTLISPDVSICDDCLRELFDPQDRRFQYPFINCTNCGPRYTIIDDVPYDRPNTSMKHFRMCPDCQREYDDPGNRRFHAQPNACPVCGPKVTLFDGGKPLEAKDPIAETAGLLKKGFIVAVKGLGGFHLAVDAENDEAVQRLRRRKHREEKPFALMAKDLDRIRRFARISETEVQLLTSPARPIVLLRKRKNQPISRAVSPRNRYFGTMLPYTPLHYLLLSHDVTALVMTSGNRSEEPIAIDNQEAFVRLADIADYFLVHDREIYLRSDDSIVRQADKGNRFLRRSRGFVPLPVFLEADVPEILAVGGELKNTICLTKGNRAFVSQHIGDMENLATEDFFRKTITHMERILDIHPRIVAHDLHPDYVATRFAVSETGMKAVAVQHHHAHIASCLAENTCSGPVIGLAFDGTGFGSDGNVWGGEFLMADVGSFDRRAHLSYVPMPGGDAAAREPWRMAVSYLHDAFGDEFVRLKIPLFEAIEKSKIGVVGQMIQKNINTPLTSSMGRLFDGVAAIVGLRYRTAYEGQAAMELEMTADEMEAPPYDYHWETASPVRIPVRSIISGVVRDVLDGTAVSRISARFHWTIIALAVDLCDWIRTDSGVGSVAMSGGVFQNVLLLEGLTRKLREKRFTVHTHKLVPCNDGGIALGQAVVAAAIKS